MDSRTTNFRLILALTAFPQDISLNGTSLKVTVGNSTKTIPLTNKEATPMDFSNVSPGAKVEFGLEDVEGFMFGYSELRVPNIAFEKNETEINEHLRFYLIDKEKDSFVANVYAIFLNKGLFKEKPKEKSPLSKNRNSPLRNASARSPTGSPSKSPVRARAEKDAEKKKEKDFQAYLNRLVDNHSTQLKSLVDEHNSINDYIQMNKLQNNLPSNFADESLENYSPVKLHDNSQLNRSHYNSRAVNDMVDQHNRSVSDFINTSQTQSQHVAHFGGRDEPMLKLGSQVLRDLSPIAAGRDGRILSDTNNGTPTKRQTSSPIQSPLKKANLDRKNSTGGSPFNSPLKGRVGDTSFEGTRREVPDTAYFKAQITNLNNVIISQNSKLADLEILRRENDELHAGLQRSDAARKALQESIQETTEELKQANRDLEKQVQGQLLDREAQLKKNNELQSLVQELQNGLAAAKASMQERDDLIDQQALQIMELDELRQRNKKLQDSLVATDKQRTRDQEAYTNSLAQIEQSLLETRKIIENLSLEKKKILSELHKAQEELSLERAAHQATQNELLLTKKRLENAESYKQVIASLEAQREQLNAQLADLRTSYAQSQSLVQESQDKIALRAQHFENKEKEFARESSGLREKLAATEARAEKLAKEVGEQKLNVVKLNSTVSSLEQLVCVKEDVNRQLEAAEKKLDQVMDDRKLLRGQLENMAANQEQTNNRLLEVERHANNLRATLEEKDEQIAHLHEAIVQLREGQEVYVPTKGDYVDNAIADFINGNRDAGRLRLLFIRETEGVYRFGSKRIYVKLEGGKILMRVGGGFLTIDEFIDQYAPLEFEKLARDDPVKRLSQNIVVNKTLIGKVVNQMEKSKNQVYEYRGDASGMRRVDGSPSRSPVGRHNSVNY